MNVTSVLSKGAAAKGKVLALTLPHQPNLIKTRTKFCLNFIFYFLQKHQKAEHEKEKEKERGGEGEKRDGGGSGREKEKRRSKRAKPVKEGVARDGLLSQQVQQKALLVATDSALSGGSILSKGTIQAATKDTARRQVLSCPLPPTLAHLRRSLGQHTSERSHPRRNPWSEVMEKVVENEEEEVMPRWREEARDGLGEEEEEEAAEEVGGVGVARRRDRAVRAEKATRAAGDEVKVRV